MVRLGRSGEGRFCVVRRERVEVGRQIDGERSKTRSERILFRPLPQKRILLKRGTRGAGMRKWRRREDILSRTGRLAKSRFRNVRLQLVRAEPQPVAVTQVPLHAIADRLVFAI